MTKEEVKEQLQEDILSILEGFRIDDTLKPEDYNSLATALCNTAINNINQITCKN